MLSLKPAFKAGLSVYMNPIQPEMSEGLKIALTALAGVTVFVIGQIIVTWFIEPIKEQRKLIGQVAHSLKYYANYDGEITSKELIREGMKNIRSLSAELDGSIVLIPCYPLLSFFRIVPKRENILAAGAQLVGISNSLGYGDFGNRRNEIVKLLRISHLLPG